jgi:hypothetical protein
MSEHHRYVVRTKDRPTTPEHSIGRGAEAEEHYPSPLDLEKAAQYLG